MDANDLIGPLRGMFENISNVGSGVKAGKKQKGAKPAKKQKSAKLAKKSKGAKPSKKQKKAPSAKAKNKEEKNDDFDFIDEIDEVST
ncbi:MAG: hypothetical protein SVJ22_06760, partial [Halobacteriota archaeon]|nr:hypothetical protein [Halobacteriota archaeon]